MSVEADPQWAEVKGMLEYVSAPAKGRTGTLCSDEARLILKAISKPEAFDRDKIGFLISDLCDQHLEHDAELGICNTGTVAFKAADQIMAWATGADTEADRLRAGIREIIAICEQDARDQDLNKSGSRNPSSKAYAEGRGAACKGIAARLRALLPDAS